MTKRPQIEKRAKPDDHRGKELALRDDSHADRPPRGLVDEVVGAMTHAPYSHLSEIGV